MKFLDVARSQPSNYTNELDQFQEKLWFIMVLQFILAAAGNGLTIYRFVTWGRPWHSGIIYAFNLALCDLFYAISLIPLAAYYYPPKDWKYGTLLCKLDRWWFFFNLYGSTFFIACISLNRYVAIVHPFFAHGRMEPFHAKVLSGIVWLLVMAISAPVLRFSTVEKRDNNSHTHCLGSAADLELDNYWAYSLFLLTFGCGLPFLLTVVSCVAIVRAALQSHSITREEKRKVKMLISMVVVLYALFYLPFHLSRNLNLHNRMHKSNKSIFILYQLTKIIIHFHVCVHPFLYAALADSTHNYCCRGFQQQEELQEKEKNVELNLLNQPPRQHHFDQK